MPIDWEVPKYAQSEVLQLIPRLSAKTLQNWLQRGLVKSNPETRGKGDHRKYAPINVVMLDFVATLTPFGVPLADAFDLAEDVAEAALALEPKLATWPAVVSNRGAEQLEVTTVQLEHLNRAIIARLPEGALYLYPTIDINGMDRMFSGAAYLVVEHEMRIIDMINRMRRIDAGETL